MSISFGEFDSIMRIVDIMLTAFSGITSYMLLSVNDLIAYVGLPVELPSWIGGDLTPLALMLGVGLPTYLVYQFITWCLNVIT